MSLHAGREGERSNEVFGVAGGESRQREGGERTRGEYNADLQLVEEGVMKTEVCFGVTIFPISN